MRQDADLREGGTARTSPAGGGGWRHRRGLLFVCLLAPILGFPTTPTSRPSVAIAAGPITSDCAARVQGWLQPALVTVGQQARLATRITFGCPDRRQPYHLVLVVDRTLLADERLGQTIRQRTEELFEGLALYRNPEVRAGLVGYDGEAELLCSLGNDAEQLQACRGRLRSATGVPLGGEGLARALYEARKALLMARDSMRQAGQPTAREAVLVIAWPPSDRAIADALDAAGTIRAAGIEIGVVDHAPADRTGHLVLLAAPGRAYVSDQWPAVIAEEARRAWATRLRIRDVSVHEFLNEALVPRLESADPANPGYDAERRVVEWQLVLDGQDAVHLSYGLSAERPGRHPVRRIGFGVYRDTWGRRGAFILPEAELVVADGRIEQLYVPLAGRFDSGTIKTIVSRD